MTIGPTGSTQQDLFQILRAAENSQTRATTGTSSATQAASSASVSVTGDSASASDAAKLIQELQQLSKSNPAEFKKITAGIAEQLGRAAQNSSDPNEASALNSLASTFTKASQTGNFSDLFSQQGNGTAGTTGQLASTAVHHGHHHGGGGVPAATSTSTSSSTSSLSSAYSIGSSSDSNSLLADIFSNALKQIQSDLNGSKQ